MPQKPATASTQDFNARIGDLRAKANDLKLRISDLEVRKSQLGEQRRAIAADVSPAPINKELADVEHQLASTRILLESMNEQIGDLETERDMSRAFSLGAPPGIATTAPAMPDAHAMNLIELERGAAIGVFLLMIPFVLAYARRIWHRSGPVSVDLENSPRLQRMEQTIESIAVEVERIGEAQRFTTKLLADRQPEAVGRLTIPRKEPGTITPH
jgi:hypothetical protein